MGELGRGRNEREEMKRRTSIVKGLYRVCTERTRVRCRIELPAGGGGGKSIRSIHTQKDVPHATQTYETV